VVFSFRPRLISCLADYDRTRLIADIGAGLTVAVVALPLAMAFAIASGLKPEAGIFTTIIAGFLVAVLGGSRVQIGGPAGAFIVIVYGIVQQYGVANLIIATALSGVMLFAMGLFRLGTLVRFIPVAVITGFTNGIAVLIALSQVKDFLGLQVPSMPADFFGILAALWAYAHTMNVWAFGIALASLAVIIVWQHGMPSLGARAPFSGKLTMVPGAIVALVLATIAVAVFKLPVETIGSRFGGIPAALPAFTLPKVSWESARFMLMPAITLALLGAIESLLCARVADEIIRDRHDPNQELMAQGIANFVVPFFGGMPATGTIARTVTNVKSGATSPIAGMVHALVLLVVILVAAPLASSIPLACLAAILLHVAWNMGEWRAFAHLRHFRMTYRGTLLSVFLLTVVFDLTVAVQVGIFSACAIFIYRMARLTNAQPLAAPEPATDADHVHAWRITGPLFFGSATALQEIEDALPSQALVLDLGAVPYMDSTGAATLGALLRACETRNVRVLMAGLGDEPLGMAQRSGLTTRPGVSLFGTLESALASARESTSQPTTR